jgi:glucose/mannose-6-phosphate isomerase
MKRLIQDFPNQLTAAMQWVEQLNLTHAAKDIHQVVITGMGGSAIGGILIKQWVADYLPVPLAVNQDYTLPAYVNQHTLLIVVSYSGNTEETLQAFQEGLEKQAKIVCMSANGLLSELAQNHHIDWISLPTGRPPRACLEYMLVAMLGVLSFYQLVSRGWTSELRSAIQVLVQKEADIQKKAQEIAGLIQGKIPVIYTITAYEGVAIRWRQQLNENSKQLCWHHTIPALNHNEIVGWQDPDDHLLVLMLIGSAVHSRIQAQQAIAQAIIQERNACSIIEGPKQSYWSDVLYFIHLGDWVSFYLAQQKATDPLVVENIERVKLSLSK